MERRALLKKIQTAMIHDHIDLSSLEIEIEEDHVVKISGISVSETDKKKIPQILNDVPGIKDCVINVSVWSNPTAG
jgi:hypothetical protein